MSAFASQLAPTGGAGACIGKSAGVQGMRALGGVVRQG